METNPRKLTVDALIAKKAEYDPALHQDMEPGPARDIFLDLCRQIHRMSIEEFRDWLGAEDG